MEQHYRGLAKQYALLARHASSPLLADGYRKLAEGYATLADAHHTHTPAATPRDSEVAPEQTNQDIR